MNATHHQLPELDLQQKKQDDAIQELQDFIADESNSNTKKMKAKIQLAGLESKDSLPLDRARINQGAAVRKQKKAEKVAKKAEAAAAYVVYTGGMLLLLLIVFDCWPSKLTHTISTKFFFLTTTIHVSMLQGRT